FAVSAVVIGRIPRERLQASRSLAKARRCFGAGFDLFAPSELRSLLASWSLAQLTWCVSNVGEVLLAREVFHVGDAGYGLLAGCSGAGLLAGSLGLGRLTDRFATGPLYRAALVSAGAGMAVAAVVGSFPIALAAIAVASAGNALA